MSKKKGKYLFGWTNLRWLIKELIKIGSVNRSFFSKKRIESGIAFLAGQFGMIFFLIHNHLTMTTSDLAIWASIQFTVAGYIMNSIQREKNNKDKIKQGIRLEDEDESIN